MEPAKRSGGSPFCNGHHSPSSHFGLKWRGTCLAPSFHVDMSMSDHDVKNGQACPRCAAPMHPAAKMCWTCGHEVAPANEPTHADMNELLRAHANEPRIRPRTPRRSIRFRSSSGRRIGSTCGLSADGGAPSQLRLPLPRCRLRDAVSGEATQELVDGARRRRWRVGVRDGDGRRAVAAACGIAATGQRSAARRGAERLPRSR